MSDIKQIQLKCLEILDIVVGICQKHDIQYSLCGGTVVGAHLYQGFLPWDDDIDLMMTRENYNRFVEVAPSCLPDGYSLVNYQMGSELSTVLRINFSKIMDDGTTFVLKEGYIMGCFIDITVYDKVPKSMFRYIDLFLYKLSMSINRGKMPGKSLKNSVRSFIVDHFYPPRISYMRFFQRVVERLSRTSNYTYRELFGAYYLANKYSYSPNVFEHYTTIEFEGRQLMIVRDYIEYLQTRYSRTDFHEPKEKQVPSHYGYVNFNLPYKEYLKTHPQKTT